MSPKIHIPSKDAATPRIADEIMCVIGEVTLILRTLAMLMRKPKTPFGKINKRTLWKSAGYAQ